VTAEGDAIMHSASMGNVSRPEWILTKTHSKTEINYINESNTMYHPKLDAAHHQSWDIKKCQNVFLGIIKKIMSRFEFF
jgi:hypothetical protein